MIRSRYLFATSKTFADNGEPPIAELCPDPFVGIPVSLVRGDQHRMNDVGQNFVDPGLAEQMEWPDSRPRDERKMMIPERMRQAAHPICDFFESGRQ